MSAINSLSNFGVPGQNGNRSAVLQPILSNRFRVVFFNFGAPGEAAPYDMTRQVRSVSRPSLSFNIETLYSYVSSIYINTRGEWNTMSIVFIDDITNSVGLRVQEQVAKQQNFFDQTMSRAGENYKFEMDIDVLAGGQSAGASAADPNIIQKWCYAGVQISEMDLGQLTYENATAMEINLTFRYDNVIGFNQDGSRMGTFSHQEEIQSKSGVSSTGQGATGGNGVSLAGASSSFLTGSLSGGVSFGPLNLGGSLSF